MSGLILPDNANRADRANDLANSISHIHATLADENDRLEQEDAHVHEVLSQLSKTAGFPGPEEYARLAREVLDDEDKAAFDEIFDNLDEQTQKYKIVFMVTGAVGAIGGAAWMTPSIIKGFSNVALGMRAIPQFSHLSLTGSLAQYRGLNRMVGRWNQAAARRPGGGAPAAPVASTRFGTALKQFARFGKFFTVASTLFFIGALISEFVQGKKLRDDLRKVIDELCAMRHVVKKMSMMLFASQGVKSKIYGYLSTKVTLDEMVASGFITAEQRDQSLEKALAEILPKLTEDVIEITDQAVAAATALIDESVKSWTNEDPSLNEILRLIEELPDLDEVDDQLEPASVDNDIDVDEDEIAADDDVEIVKSEEVKAGMKQRRKLRRRIRKSLRQIRKAEKAEKANQTASTN